ncbi:uncharacterized protein TOT_030000673 [Theileria orientalis strain Shintoku]|uniref:SAP domain-containing protein n=1 Tax=Theileria orientalis strain Shintoku TaxID=869250 RepID=J4C418_THEOR|nr:uncharacterized protein TOT_030000673 [Theileria orientalis strain Shintoku]BAM41411.1 uncharacterized protein TOT_030000673 [Theileria orientalis strain Shintoku]|eukprot:XP_009691712.1 uncharacterized protein TOT_030000673 [Theileria orientalis strain Shintoku]
MDVLLISQRMAEEVENMTIPELKAVLAKYNLETTGKRADLVARLSNHFKQKDEKGADGTKSVKASPKIEAKSPKTAPKATKAPSAAANEGATEAVSSGPPKLELEEPKTPEKSPSPPEGPKKEVTEMTMEERLALRAKRFNLEIKPDTGLDKKLDTSLDRKLGTSLDKKLDTSLEKKPEAGSEKKADAAKSQKKLVVQEDPEVLKKRSERFGIPLVTHKSDEPKVKKKFDFVVDEEELLKRQKRLERFSS